MSQRGPPGSDTHLRFSLEYHAILITKQHADLLDDDVSTRFHELAETVAPQYDVTIEFTKGATDHLYLQFTATPTTNLNEFLTTLKGVTSRRLRGEFPHLETRFERGVWQSGYYLSTTGSVTIEEIITYVEGPTNSSLN
ncbi:putative transposase [Halogranum rubrum]|uniref:Putative transposase n=1 Tax=Halogranum rubrum TaxID=553466 RepID=A0A1I4B9F0_9EURY|nr:putative transposase [Halogranum rubrum]